MDIEKTHDGNGREKQPDRIHMEKAADGAACQAEEERQRDSHRCQDSGTYPQILLHGQIGQQHARQQDHQLQYRT